MPATLTKSELERFSRQISLDEIGLAGQAALKNASVLIVGAGGLGCPCMAYLASCGVGRIGIVDRDRVELSNLHRQIMFGESDIGKPKVEAAAARLHQFYPALSVESYFEAFSVENALRLAANYDVVVDASDNFAARYLLNDACVVAGKAWVGASILKFDAQLSVYNALLPGGRRGPTYRCLFPEPPPPEMVPSCADLGVLGVLPGILGTMQANECLKLILGTGETLSGRLLLINALDMKFRCIEYARDEERASAASIRDAAHYAAICSDSRAAEDEISLEEARAIPDGKLFVVDVREPHERALAHAGGEHIPLRELERELDRIPADCDVLFYCRSGVRSKKAITMIKQSRPGQKAYSLKGGLIAYGFEV